MTREKNIAAFAIYDTLKAKFRAEHKPIACKECRDSITPGDDHIWVSEDGGVFCCSECLARAMGGRHLDFHDAAYDEYFDKSDSFERWLDACEEFGIQVILLKGKGEGTALYMTIREIETIPETRWSYARKVPTYQVWINRKRECVTQDYGLALAFWEKNK